MKKSIGLLAAAVGLAITTSAYAASNITYSINQIIGPGSAIGTITTDGTIGTLSAANIVAFNLTLNDGSSGTANVNQSNAVVYDNANGCCSIGTPNGADLTASSSSLMFNYGGTDAGFFSISNSLGQRLVEDLPERVHVPLERALFHQSVAPLKETVFEANEAGARNIHELKMPVRTDCPIAAQAC